MQAANPKLAAIVFRDPRAPASNEIVSRQERTRKDAAAQIVGSDPSP
jgi:hypothetical protein